MACTEVDGQPIAITTSHDNTARVWHLSGVVSEHIAAGHTSNVLAVACTEVGGQPIAITTSHDDTGTMLAVLDYTGYTTGALCSRVQRRVSRRESYP